MLYERHKRGKIFGGEVEICPGSFLDRDSFIGDKADIWQSRLICSRVQFESRVRKTRLEYSSVGGANVCELNECNLISSNFAGGTALNCYLHKSQVSGNPYFRGIGRGVSIIESHISDHVRLENDVAVIGIELNKQMRLCCGIWKRPPRYLEIKTNTVDIGVTESIDGFATVACQHKKMTKWIKGKNRFGNAIGWSRNITDKIALTFEQWLDEPMETN